MTVRANYDDIVMISVMGEIVSPRFPESPYSISNLGEPLAYTRSGGITYNVRVGDRAIGWAADHTEPCVTLRNKEAADNAALNILSCIGNDAYVVSGDGKGSKGTVTGKHGGAHTMVDFPPETLERLAIGDKVQVRAYGRGLRLLDAPDVTLHSVSAQLLNAWPLTIEDGVVTVPVAGIVPPELFGAGIGHSVESVDFDIQTHDRSVLEAHGLHTLRLGDIVALRDYDGSFGHGYRKGCWAIACVAHADSVMAGHGPGVDTLLTAPAGRIRPERAAQGANIADILGLRA